MSIGALILVVLTILIGTYFFLPESKKPVPNFSLKPLPIPRNFAGVLKHPHFITYALTGAISMLDCTATLVVHRMFLWKFLK
jgi:DHA1 family bicyclomycin/chloramphenicol resistance-like MFS transporter